MVRPWSGRMRDKRHMSIRQNLQTRLGWAWALALPLWCSFACAQTLGLPQVLEAARNNLDVSMAQQAAEAARADVLAADRSPFPIFTAKTSQMDLEHGIGAGSFGQKKIDKSGGIDWTWERGNKRGLRTQSAQRQASAANADLQDMRVMQQLGAASAYFDLLAALERNRDMQALANSAKQLAQSATLRLKAGDLSAQESARLEIEAQRAQADAYSAQLDQERAVLLLGQFTNLRINLAGWHIQADWPALEAMLDVSTVQEAWLDQRPDVVAALERVSAARAALELAQAQKKSDLTLGTSVDHYPTQSSRLLEFEDMPWLKISFLAIISITVRSNLVLVTETRKKSALARWLQVQDRERRRDTSRAALPQNSTNSNPGLVFRPCCQSARPAPLSNSHAPSRSPFGDSSGTDSNTTRSARR